MVKATTTTPEGDAVDGATGVGAPEALDTRVTVDDFCARKSETMRRAELLGGFAHSEQVHGTVMDTVEAFEARLTAFINKPV
jgi:hypothetical protein